MSDFDWSKHLSENRESEFPPTFKFEDKGASVTGTITRIDEWDDNGKVTPILELEYEDQKSSVFVSQVILRDKVAALNPQVGDGITMTFVGLLPPTKNGGRPKDFDVTVTKKQADPDEEPF